MSDSGWGTPYPGLGFDPLPGDPEAAGGLASDATILGDRLHEQAAFLRKAAHPESWAGDAADAFVEQLGELPDEMDRMGDAFVNLGIQLRLYEGRFQSAKQHVADLDRQALEARARAQRLFDTEHGPGGPRIDPRPAFLPKPDPSLRPFPASSSPDLVAANEALVDILEQAKRLHEDFDQAQSDLEVRIRDLSQWAPDAPEKNWFDRLADSASSVTGIDSLADAVSGFDDLLENSARFLSNLSDVLQGVSAICGTASLLMFWLPGASAALGTLSLAAAGGAAAVKTGLYLTGAKDDYGRPYVRGGELTASLVSFGVGAAGAGVGAAAAKAKDVRAATAAAARGARTSKEAVAGAKAAKDAGSSVASRVAGKFRPGVLKEGLADDMTMLRSRKALFGTAGRKAFMERTAAEIGQNFAAMSRPERALVVGGRVVDLGFPIISPLATGDEPRLKDVGGLRPAIGEIRKLPEEFVRLVEHGSDPLNLRARVEPPEPRFTTPAEPLKPVMDS